MSKVINAIDKGTVHRICSGQVVLDLATAVKELVENSIDAGATLVEIKFKDNGVEGIEVRDDGSGIDPVNYESLALKHHTSKISEFEDLEQVITFGFRGEALSSLCAVSQMTVTTATKEQAPMGVKLEYDENGLLESKTPTSRSVGTTVQLSNIFHSLPVRQKEFKRNSKKEYGKALAVLQAYSIISTNIKISVSNQSGNKKSTMVMSTSKNKDITSNISNIYGAKIVSQIMPFQVDLKNVLGKGCVEGYISKPEWGVGRSSLDRQHFYVNGRPCTLPKMASALNEIYRSFISNQYPLIIADFKIPTNAYDVNVSPDKRTIFIHEESKIAEAILEQLRHTMEPSRSTFQMNSLIHPDTNDKVQKTTQVSLQSFALVGGSDYKPKITRNNKRSYKADEQENNVSIRAYLYKKSKIEENESTQECQEDNTRKGIQKEIAETMQVDEEIRQEIIGLSNVNGNNEQEATGETTVDINVQEATGEVKVDESVRREATNVIETSDSGQQETTEIDIELTEHEETLKSEENNTIEPVTDEQQYIEKDRTIKLAEGGTKTTGYTMTIHTKEPGTMTAPNTHNDKDPLTDKADFGDFLFNAGVQNVQDSDKADEALSRVIHKSDFKRMRVLGQFNLGFMITSLDDQDLYIIDQHASDEKYNFETLPKKVKVNNQKLISPQIPDITAAEELIVMDNLEVFKLNGFDVEVLPENEPTQRIRVLSQPVTKKAMLDKKDFSELIFLLSEHPGEMVRCSRNRAIFASMACHKAVRIGHSLTRSKMTKIVRNMGEIDQPWNCPHGRPTMRHLMSLSQFKQTTQSDSHKRELTFRGTLFE